MTYLYNYIGPLTLDIGNFYIRYAHFIDPVVVFTLFLCISQWVFTRKYKSWDGNKPSKEAKGMAIAISLALTAGFAVWESRSSFTFAQLDGLAALVFMLVLGIFLYEGLLALFGEHGKQCAASSSYLLIYGVFLLPFTETYHLMHDQYPVVWSVLGIGFLMSIIGSIICMVKMAAQGGSTTPAAAPTAPAAPTTAPPGVPPTTPATPTSAPPTPPGAVAAPALEPLLNAYEANVMAYGRALARFRATGDSVLRARAAGNAAAENLALQDFIAAGSTLAQDLRHAGQALAALSHHPELAHASTGQARRLGQITHAYTSFSRELDQYFTAWQLRYAARRGP